MKDPETIAPEENYLGAATGEEARFFGNLPRQVGQAPESAKRVDFRLGEDSDGSPAVWITIIANDDLKPSRQKIDEFTQYSQRLRDAVLNSGFGRWPYVRIKTE